MTVRLHHLAITATDVTKGAAFYDAILGPLGYRRGHTSDELCTWIGPNDATEILLYAVEGDDSSPHRLGRPGWHHAALAVHDRGLVDAIHQAVCDGGWTVIHTPKEYDYSPGYYATFVTDPDGTRWEVAHVPTPTH